MTSCKEKSQIVGDKLSEAFTFDQRVQYMPVAKTMDVKANKFSCTFPPYSLTQIKIVVKKK